MDEGKAEPRAEFGFGAERAQVLGGFYRAFRGPVGALSPRPSDFPKKPASLFPEGVNVWLK
jgi:hypothetical protein